MADSCGFSGNSDLYGLGIRLGVYLQWLSAVVATSLRLTDSFVLFTTYSGFSFAIMVALLVLTAQRTAHVLEIVIMLHMFFGGLYATIPRQIRGFRPRSQVSDSLIMLASVMMMVFSSWFWISGRNSDAFLATPCGNTIFLLARISPAHFGRVSRFFAAFSTFFTITISCWSLFLLNIYLAAFIQAPWGTIRNQSPAEKMALLRTVQNMHIPVMQDLLQHYCGLPATTAARAQVVSVTETYILFMEGNPAVAYTIPLRPPLREHPELGRRIFDMWENLQMIGPSPDSSSDEVRIQGMDHIRRVFPGFGYFGRTGTEATEGRRLWNTRVILGPASFLYSVLAIELMLRWNRVSGIYAIDSTGQLIPLAVAVVAFMDLLLSITRKCWVSRR
ncbi:hypothetical protein BJX66DRAFT_132214 [Aspergillus keveii]|uniref:Uncharacterized protein n=1 Tax=Aspergillus keveii TaxID=714993 RepID=A0ABR4FJB1_9EURO